MRRPLYQFFSLEEYQERLDALRSRMEQRGIDVLMVTTPENLYYLSGYQTPGYYWYQTLIVLPDREPVLITRLNESANIEPLSWVEDARPYGDAEDWIVKDEGDSGGPRRCRQAHRRREEVLVHNDRRSGKADRGYAIGDHRRRLESRRRGQSR